MTDILLMIVGGVFILFLGYALGVRDERKYGQAAAQQMADQEIAKHNDEEALWRAVEKAAIDLQPVKKPKRDYGHLRLIK